MNRDILRAELSAIYRIMIGPAYGVFCTDSSAALDLIQKTLGANCVSQFSHLEHLDLLLPIWETRNNHSCALQKIKAHLEAASFSDSIDAYECLCNKFANDTAQQVNTVFCLSMVSELEALHKRNSADKQRLEQVFSFARLDRCSTKPSH